MQRFLRLPIGLGLAVAAVLTISLLGGVGPADSRRAQPPLFRVRVLVLTTFDGEQEPWLSSEDFDLTYDVRGAFAPVHCQSTTNICVTMTGTTKSNAGPSTMAIVRDPQLRFNRRSLFIVDGIAGIRSSVGTLGTVGIANWVVDLDVGTHLRTEDVAPDGWLPFSDYPEAALHLNEDLAAHAFEVASEVELTDDEAASTERAHYGEPEASDTPSVQRCDTGGSDGFWIGTWWADKADRILRERILAVDPTYDGYRCSSEFEDPAIANALNRFGFLDQLVVVRAASDLEDERPGQTTQELYDLLHSSEGFAGYNISRENGYRVASAIAHDHVSR